MWIVNISSTSTWGHWPRMTWPLSYLFHFNQTFVSRCFFLQNSLTLLVIFFVHFLHCKKGLGEACFHHTWKRHRLFLYWINGPDDIVHNSGEGFEKQATIRVLSPHSLFCWASCWYYWFHRFVLSLPGVTNANTCSSCYMCSLFFEEPCTESPRTDQRDTWAQLYNLCTDLWLSREQRNIDEQLAICHMSTGLIGQLIGPDPPMPPMHAIWDLCGSVWIFCSTNTIWNLLTPVWIFGVELSARQATQSCADSRRGSKQKQAVSSSEQSQRAVASRRNKSQSIGSRDKQ